MLKLVIAYALVILLYRLIREHQRSRPSSLQLPAVPLATTVVAILGTVAFIVGGSLLLAYIATARMAVLIPSLLINGLGVLALAAVITRFIRKPHSPASENKLVDVPSALSYQQINYEGGKKREGCLFSCSWTSLLASSSTRLSCSELSVAYSRASSNKLSRCAST
jgi:hypothetical protein